MQASVAYIGIGSNLGDKVANCRHSIASIDGSSRCEVMARSDLFKTEPEGVAGQQWYANCVVEVKTARTPRQLLDRLMAIEHEMGRIRTKKWESRIIDLDLLLFSEQVLDLPDLVVPHPLLHTRRFVLEPLVQLAPELVHPVLNVTIRRLLDELPKVSYVEILKEEA
jgi:2-amino-4-hydroxy-6-hydroxymethyldihydropteridine diphosphokinase